MKKSKNETGILRKYGILKIIFSIDTIISISVFSMIYIIIPYINIENKIGLVREFAGISITISLGILAIVIAALSIIVSMIGEEFLEFIFECNAYYDFCAPFFLESIIWCITIIVNIILYILSYVNGQNSNIIILLSVSGSLIITGIKGVLDLVKIIIELSKYKRRFRTWNKSQKSDIKIN